LVSGAIDMDLLCFVIGNQINVIAGIDMECIETKLVTSEGLQIPPQNCHAGVTRTTISTVMSSSIFISEASPVPRRVAMAGGEGGE
jgi:hypothetical protein